MKERTKWIWIPGACSLLILLLTGCSKPAGPPTSTSASSAMRPAEKPIASATASVADGKGEESMVDQQAAAQESQAISKSAGLAIRNGDILELHLSPLTSLTLRNKHCKEANEVCDSFVYMGLIMNNKFFLVHEIAGEFASDVIDDQYLAVATKSAEIFTLMEHPEVSPDGQRVAVVKASEQSDVFGIEVWELADNRLVRRFQSKENHFRFSNWATPEKIVLTTQAPDGSATNRQVNLIYKESQWKQEEEPPAKKPSATEN